MSWRLDKGFRDPDIAPLFGSPSGRPVGSLRAPEAGSLSLLIHTSL
jgi:hypothetical protein